MKIEFEELDLSIQGIPVAPLEGSFDVDVDGDIYQIVLSEWCGRKRRQVFLSANTTEGLGRVFWHILRPVLRQTYATQIADHVNRSEPSFADENRHCVREMV
jgi:hypothetical protein